MKFFKFSILALTALLVGCNSHEDAKADGTITTSQHHKASLSNVLPLDEIPIGRWFHNPKHCQNELPIVGPYDFNVTGNEITFIGLKDSGTWFKDDNKAAIEAFISFISKNESCVTVGMNSFNFIRFTGEASSYTLAYAQEQEIMLRYKNGEVEIIVPFNVDNLKKLKIVDNSDQEGPDDET